MTDILYAFFSYATADARLDPTIYTAFSTELTQRVSAHMAGGELRSWRDNEKIALGEDWYPKIIDSLKNSHVLIIMLTPNWLKSKWCREEYEIFEEVEKAYGNGGLIAPILLRDIEREIDFLTAEQRAIYESIKRRQYRAVPVSELLKSEPALRSAQLEAISIEMRTMLAPFRSKPSPAAANTAAPASDPIAATPTTLPPHNLPLKSLGRLFMGREAFMADLEAKLKGDGAAAVTEGVLQGMGGVGKTRLAIEYAWRHAKDYRALLFVSAETPETLATGLAALAATLNLPEQQSPQDPVKREAVLRWFARERGWLLILDNVDDEKAAAAVADLLPQLANGVTLITARYDGFPASIETMPLGVLKPEPARDFLLARTKGRRRDAADDHARAEELAKELGYLALALEQAGAFVSAQRISFERYLAYWRDERARVFDWFDKTAMGTNHNKGLAAVFATSVARLSPNGRRLLDRVAFLAPEPIPEFLLDVTLPSSFETPATQAPQDEGSDAAPATAQTTEAAPLSGPHAEEAPQEPSRSTRAAAESSLSCNETFDARAALAELYAYSLAAPTEIEGRYAQPAFVVHRLVQDYARACVVGARRDEKLREALGWVDAAFDSDAGDVRNWPRLDPLAVHALAITETADKAGVATPTSRIMNGVGYLFKGQARNREAEPLYRRALTIDEKGLGPDHPEVAIRLNNLAQLLQGANRLDEAERLMRRALTIDEKAFGPDHPYVAIRLNNLAQLLKTTNRPDEAEPLFHRAVQIFAASFDADHPNTRKAAGNYRYLLFGRGASEAEAESKVAAALRGE